MSPLGSVVAGAVETTLGEAGARWWCVASGEWGITAEAAGWPLHIGLALRGGLLRAQAEVLGAGVADPASVLRRNRALLIARFSAAEDGAIWIQGEIPERAAMDAGEVDRLLGLVLSGAQDLRAGYAARRRARSL